MSYNTRRTPQGRGGPGPQTQVNYHQGNVGSSIGRGNSRHSPNQGYSTASAQNFPQQQFVSQGYSTAPPPAPPVQKSSPVPAPIQQMPLTAPPPVPQLTAPLPKTEPVALALEQEETNGEGPPPTRPHWMKKGPAVKVSRKTRKRRQNARLRRLLIPKNSLMFLNELHSGAKFTCQERVNALSQFVYTVTVEVDGKVFTGHGMSKLAAKSQASENALKILILEKMAQSQIDVPSEPTGESRRRALAFSACSYPQLDNYPYYMDLPDNSLSCDESLIHMKEDDVEMDEETKESICGDEGSLDDSRRKPLPEDDLPWGSLAAFALHKLFAEWQQQGAQVPLAKTPSIPIPPSRILGPSPMKKIPEDASKRHPVSLLNQIKPGSAYKESHEGSLPNMTFTITVNIDGKDYVGKGTSKREAKKECAKAALAAMGIQSEV